MPSPSTSPRRPSLHPWCRVVRDGDRYLLERGRTVVTFEGRAARTLMPELLPRLDGTRTLDEIVTELGRSIAPAIEHAVSLLEANQLLVDGSGGAAGDDVGRTAAAVLAATGGRRTTAGGAYEALREARVLVLGSGTGASAIVAELTRMGVGRVEVGEADSSPTACTLAIAAPSNDEVSHLLTLNVTLLESAVPWLQVLPFDGRTVVVGPLYLPRVSACRECYVVRRRACSGYEADAELLDREELGVQPPAPLTAIAAGLAALVALRWIATQDPTLPGRLYALDVGTTLRLSYDHLLRVPRCSACGPPARAVPSPWFETA